MKPWNVATPWVYGLLVVANYVDDHYDWIFYAAEGGLGIFILKRTFTMRD